MVQVVVVVLVVVAVALALARNVQAKQRHTFMVRVARHTCFHQHSAPSTRPPLQVIDTLRASAYVPGWSGVEPSILFQGDLAFDGFFSQALPCPPNITFCIKVMGSSSSCGVTHTACGRRRMCAHLRTSAGISPSSTCTHTHAHMRWPSPRTFPHTTAKAFCKFPPFRPLLSGISTPAV